MSKKPLESQSKGDPLTPMMRPDPQLISHLMQPTLSANAAWLELSSRFFFNAAESATEILNFVGRRLQRDADFFEELCRVESPQAAMSSYSRFVQRAANDYQKEFAEMARLSTKGADGAAEAMKSASDRFASRARPDLC